jgi:hypothetical protein
MCPSPKRAASDDDDDDVDLVVPGQQQQQGADAGPLPPVRVIGSGGSVRLVQRPVPIQQQVQLHHELTQQQRLLPPVAGGDGGLEAMPSGGVAAHRANLFRIGHLPGVQPPSGAVRIAAIFNGVSAYTDCLVDAGGLIHCPCGAAPMDFMDLMSHVGALHPPAVLPTPPSQ